MPYIKDSERQRFAAALTAIESNVPHGPGELNYLISSILCLYSRQSPLNYARINEIIGAMDAAKLEFYRRVAAPYEDKKVAENGDVYMKEFVTAP